MVFPSGPRQRGTEFAVTKRATERHDSANDPKQEQREYRLNVCQLKAKAGKDSRADDVGDNDGRCRKKTNSSPLNTRLHRTAFGKCCHFWIDNLEIILTSEFFRSGLQIHDWFSADARCRDTLVAIGKFFVVKVKAESQLGIFLGCQKPFPASR